MAADDGQRRDCQHRHRGRHAAAEPIGHGVAVPATSHEPGGYRGENQEQPTQGGRTAALRIKWSMLIPRPPSWITSDWDCSTPQARIGKQMKAGQIGQGEADHRPRVGHRKTVTQGHEDQAGRIDSPTATNPSGCGQVSPRAASCSTTPNSATIVPTVR